MKQKYEDEIILEGRDISKVFFGVQALKRINIGIKKNEVHAIVGENGSGKSTLIKIFSGFYTMNEGEIFFEGEKVRIDSTEVTTHLGIKTVYQEPEVASQLTVAENIMLGKEPLRYGLIDNRRLYEKAQKSIKALNLDKVLNPGEKVENLNIYKKKLLEICKICSATAKVIIMDEPTAGLSRVDIENLFQIISVLKEKDITIIYISHFLEEIFEIADTVSVLRDGELVSTLKVADTHKDEIIRMMTGKNIITHHSRSPSILKDKVVLSVKNITRDSALNGISFNLHEGEILGITGLAGAGRTELARAIIGLDKIERGEIYIDGKKVRIRNPRDAIKYGIAYLTEDRHESLVGILSVYTNIILATLSENSYCNFWIKIFGSKKRAGYCVDRLRIQTPNLHTPVDILSGGNQQKVVLARWIVNKNLKILILDDPTVGIDIGTKEEIYQIIQELKNQGMSIILISSFFEEVLKNSDRILVMRQGNLVGEFYPQDLSPENLLRLSLPKVKR